MAGHSKWNNIQHRKGRQDAKRAKIFTRLTRRSRSPPGWVAATRHIRAIGWPSTRRPRTTCQGQHRARDRQGAGADAENYEEVRYEGYGPAGAAMIVDA